MNMFRLPESVKTPPPRDMWLIITGMEPGAYVCPKCQHPPERPLDAPPGYCRPGQCGCPMPLPCASCSNIVHPVQEEGFWDRPLPYCQECSGGRHRAHLQEVISKIIPRELRQLSAALYRVPHREPAIGEIHRWVLDRMGSRAGRSCLLIYGSRGSGKSVIAALATRKAITDGAVSNALFITEDQITRAAVDQFADAKDTASKARGLLHVAAHVPLLVLDELGGNKRAGYSPRERKEVTAVLHKRLSGRMPTLLISNLVPVQVGAEGRLSHLGWLDERIDSRFAGCGIPVECSGPDMRLGDRGTS